MLSRLKTMKKTTRSNLITFGIVIVFYLVVQILSGAGLTTRSFEGQLTACLPSLRFRWHLSSVVLWPAFSV